MAPSALDLAVDRQTVRALPWPQRLPGRGLDALANRLKLLLSDLAPETELLGAAAVPVTDHALAFGVVVAVHQVIGRVPSAVRHRPNRQHARRPCVRRTRWNDSANAFDRAHHP